MRTSSDSRAEQENDGRANSSMTPLTTCSGAVCAPLFVYCVLGPPSSNLFLRAAISLNIAKKAGQCERAVLLIQFGTSFRIYRSFQLCLHCPSYSLFVLLSRKVDRQSRFRHSEISKALDS